MTLQSDWEKAAKGVETAAAQQQPTQPAQAAAPQQDLLGGGLRVGVSTILSIAGTIIPGPIGDSLRESGRALAPSKDLSQLKTELLFTDPTGLNPDGTAKYEIDEAELRVFLLNQGIKGPPADALVAFLTVERDQKGLLLTQTPPEFSVSGEPQLKSGERFVGELVKGEEATSQGQILSQEISDLQAQRTGMLQELAQKSGLTIGDVKFQRIAAQNSDIAAVESEIALREGSLIKLSRQNLPGAKIPSPAEAASKILQLDRSKEFTANSSRTTNIPFSGSGTGGVKTFSSKAISGKTFSSAVPASDLTPEEIARLRKKGARL